MATVRDVAKLAGVSPATVCRVLSREPNFKVTEETRRRVEECAEQLGYHYMPRQRKQNSIRIGVILPMTSQKYSDPFFSEILVAAENECIKHSADIVSVKTVDELKYSEVFRGLCNEKLTGLILCEELPDSLLDELRNEIPYIVTADLPDSPFDCVGYDYYIANKQVMDLLIEKGYRRIAYIGGGTLGKDFMQSVRMVVYRDSLYGANIPLDISLIRDCNWDLDSCQQHTIELMSLSNPPDVIFAGSDSLAVVVLNTLYQLGYKCPDDVGVIGFNNAEISAHTFPPLTTVDIQKKEIGIELIRRIIEKINDKDSVPRTTLFPTQIMERSSLR